MIYQKRQNISPSAVTSKKLWILLPGYLRPAFQPGFVLRPGAGAEAGGEEEGGAGGGQAGGGAAEAGGGEAEEDRAGEGGFPKEVKECDGKEEL